MDMDDDPSPPPLPPVLSRRHAIHRSTAERQDRSTMMFSPPRPPVYRSSSSNSTLDRERVGPHLNGTFSAPPRSRSDPKADRNGDDILTKYGFRNQQVELNLKSFASFKASFGAEEEHMKVFRESAVLSLRRSASNDAPKLNKSLSSSSSNSSVKLSSFDRQFQFLILDSVTLRGSMSLRSNSIRTKTWILRHTGTFRSPSFSLSPRRHHNITYRNGDMEECHIEM